MGTGEMIVEMRDQAAWKKHHSDSFKVQYNHRKVLSEAAPLAFVANN